MTGFQSPRKVKKNGIDMAVHEPVHEAGHRTQQEKPHEVSKVLIDWLDRKVAPGPE